MDMLSDVDMIAVGKAGWQVDGQIDLGPRIAYQTLIRNVPAPDGRRSRTICGRNKDSFVKTLDDLNAICDLHEGRTGTAYDEVAYHLRLQKAFAPVPITLSDYDHYQRPVETRLELSIGGWPETGKAMSIHLPIDIDDPEGDAECMVSRWRQAIEELDTMYNFNSQAPEKIERITIVVLAGDGHDTGEVRSALAACRPEAIIQHLGVGSDGRPWRNRHEGRSRLGEVLIKRKCAGPLGQGPVLAVRNYGSMRINGRLISIMNMDMPETALSAMTDRLIEDVVDHPLFKDSGLMIENAWVHRGKERLDGTPRRPILRISVGSERLDLEGAVALASRLRRGRP